jgi:predicted transcriptional regulator
MPSNIVGATKLSAQRQMAPMEYVYETKLVKLRENNGCNFTSGSKRGRLEIMAEILCHCNQQKTKTNIMYKVNLNYSQLKKHLKSLTSQGLLTTDKNEYATTQKGYRFLELFIQLNDILIS